MDVREDMPDVPLWKVWRRRRYVVTLLTFLGFFNIYALRVNVSVAIVDMTENKTHVLGNGTKYNEPEFDWDTTLQGHVLSAFFYGYLSTQLLGGWLALRIGGHVLMSVAVAGSAVLSLVTPWIVSHSVFAFIAVRAMQGMVQGVSYPAAQALYSRWAPPSERGLLANVGYSGCDLGTVVAMTLSGVLIDELKWDSVFYFFGIVGLLWTVLWVMVVRRGPEEDHRIDPRELEYIQDSLGGPPVTQKGPYPWKSLLTSTPVLAVIIANVTANWGFYTLLIEMPTFMKETLNFNMKESGVMSALPLLMVFLMLPVAGLLADWLINREFLTVGQVRKSFCCGSFAVQAMLMMVVAFVMTQATAVVALTISVGAGAFAYATFFVNSLDIAPEYASIIVGLSNTAGTVPGIVSPILTGYIVPNRTKSEWQLVFLIASAIYIVGTVCYGIFASGKTQPWAKQNQK